MHCFNIFVQVQSLEKTFVNFLIFGKSRFPPKTFYNIDYRAIFPTKPRPQHTFVLSSNLFFCSAISITPFRARATSGQSVECWKYIEPPAGGAGGGGDPTNPDLRFSALEKGRERWSVEREWRRQTPFKGRPSGSLKLIHNVNFGIEKHFNCTGSGLQLAERLLTAPKDPGSNPVSGKFNKHLFAVNCREMSKNR